MKSYFKAKIPAKKMNTKFGRNPDDDKSSINIIMKPQEFAVFLRKKIIQNTLICLAVFEFVERIMKNLGK